jgi:hypothetical protein
MDLACSRHGEDEIPRGIKNLVGAYREGKVIGRPRIRWKELTETNIREVGCGDVE